MTRADAWWAAGLVVTATVCGALAHRLSLTRSQVRTDLVELTTLQERVTKLETVAASPAPPPPIIPPPSPAPQEPVPAKPSLVDVRRAYEAADRRMYADPRARAAMRLTGKSLQRQQHPDLARVLGLSAEEEDRFLELLAEQQIAWLERSARKDGRYIIHGGEYEEAQRARDVEHMAMLGADKYQRFQRYRETRLDRTRVRQFRRQLDPKDDLTDESGERLIDVLAAAREKDKRSMDETRDGRVLMSTHVGITLYGEPDEENLEKEAARLEETDGRLAAETSVILNATQQRHFIDYLRRSRESVLAMAKENFVRSRP
jgi:hypothetical protein